jgi:hypothetical protein
MSTAIPFEGLFATHALEEEVLPYSKHRHNQIGIVFVASHFSGQRHHLQLLVGDEPQFYAPAASHV